MRQAFGTNDAIQVITPTGNAAYFVGGCTAHSFLRISTGGRSCNELSAPSGPPLEKIQKKCGNVIENILHKTSANQLAETIPVT